jgi:hypothetical protein
MKRIAQWTKRSTLDETLTVLKKLALLHTKDGGADGERIASCIARDDFLSLCNFSLSYEATTAWHASNCRQALAFFSKLEPLPLRGIDKREVAKTKWLMAENACKETNYLFWQRSVGLINFSPTVESILHRARLKIASVLGEVPKLADLQLRYGPGATTLMKKGTASTAVKLGQPLACSESLLPFVPLIMEQLPHLVLLNSEPDEISGTLKFNVSVMNDKVTFVRKTAKEYRGISIGSSMNIMVQLAYGDYIATQLLRVGQDITDQARNQNLAQIGSLDGSLATLDLSSASDTIATALVYELLPFDWAYTLDAIRCAKCTLDDVVYTTEKFSSMGNGFTFPLETLIFWALSSSASTDNYASVYGDDIIVSTDSVTAVKQILTHCGFTVNESKSFVTGPFRESCGADYFRGFDIRPCYVKDRIAPMDLFRLHNFYYRRDDLEKAALVKALIHPALIIYGPDGYGDGHLLGDWRPKKHKKSESHGYGGFIFETYSLVSLKDMRSNRPGDRVLPVYTIYRRPTDEIVELNPVSREGFTLAMKLRRAHTAGGHGMATSIEIPERISQVDKSRVKILPYPAVDDLAEYKKISIYTLSAK